MGECKLRNSNREIFHQGKRFNWLKLEPKSKFITKHINYEANIEKVFGKVVKFKTTNTHLHADIKKELLHLSN
jgi:hypothetical protein